MKKKIIIALLMVSICCSSFQAELVAKGESKVQSESIEETEQEKDDEKKEEMPEDILENKEDERIDINDKVEVKETEESGDITSSKNNNVLTEVPKGKNEIEEKREWIEYDPARYGDIINASILRKEPKKEAEVVKEIVQGERILLEGFEENNQGSWYKTSYEGIEGYILVSDVELSYQSYESAKKGETTANLYMRSDVGTSYGKIQYLPLGSEIELLGYYRTEGHDWYKAKHNEVIGYISSKYVVRVEDKYEWIEYNPDRYGDVQKDTVMRSEPRNQGVELIEITTETRVMLEGYVKFGDGSWYKVIYGEETGYVSEKDIDLSYQPYAPVKKGETTANLYMRNGVGLSYDKKKYLPAESEIELLGYYRTEGYDWYKIKYNGSLGYVSSKYVVRTEDKYEWIEYNPDRYGDVQKDTVMTSKARGEGVKLAEIPPGTRLILAGYKKFSSGSWYKVVYKEKTGYISAKDIKLSYQSYKPEKVGKTKANMYVRSGVGLSYTKKKYLSAGNKILLLGYYRTDGYDWYKVKVNGIVGYVSSKYIVRMEDKAEWIGYNPDRYGDVKKATILSSKPRGEGKELINVPKGTRIILDGYEKFLSGSWYKTRYQGKIGYVSAEDVKLSYQSYSPTKVGKTTANLYVRSGVGASYNKKKYLPAKSIVVLLGYYRTDGYDWYKVECDGVTGYISSKYVKVLKITTKLKKVTDKNSAMYGKILKLYYSNGKQIQNLESIVGKKSNYILYVNKNKQMVTAYYQEGSYYVPYKAMICSSGAVSSYTPNGTFYTPAKYRWHTLMGPCWGQWCTRINGGILFHSVFYNSKNNNQTLSVNAYNKLGSPASHGCVRLTAGDAKWIYDNCKLKTKVIVCNKRGYEPLKKPMAYKLGSTHRWDPTDPNVKYKCKQKGCH